jgi:predicted RNA-binding Zn ribbon-like protein
VPFDADDRSALLAAVLADSARDAVELAALRVRLEGIGMAHLPVRDHDVARVHELGRDLDGLFGRDATDTVAAIDAALVDLEVRPRLSTHDGRPPHLHFEREGADAVERMRVNTVLGLARFVASDGPGRLGRCAADGCDRVFLDVSRNGRRRFCAAACANRTHVAAHRARRRKDVA